jgi:hypothetical protein
MKHWMWSFIWLITLVAMSAVPAWADEPGLDIVEPLVPFHYACVWSTQVPVYPAPGDPTQMVPVRDLLPPNTWVSIKDEVQMDQLVWYRIEKEKYVLASDVLLASPSTFHGVAVGQAYHPPFGFVVADYLNVRVRPSVAPDNPSLDMLPRYTVVNILGQETTSDGVWYQIGPDRYVYSAYVKVVTAAPRPSDVAPDEKWVAVNLSEQTLAAYEGDQMVFATLVSTGLPWWRTPEGLFRIWVKLYAGKMSGGSVEANDYYYLEDVPWTMYFHRGYALHAAYWHDGFGYPRSRGCINLSPRDARWLFDWASPSLPEGRRAVLSEEDNPGTWVYVYSTTADLALAHAPPGAVP